MWHLVLAWEISNCNCIIGGDFNVDLDSVNAFSPNATKYSYIIDALNCQRTIDYFLISDISNVCQFYIIDHDSNLLDHLPLYIVCNSAMFEATGKPIGKDDINSVSLRWRFRWYHGDLLSYYDSTRQLLQPVRDDINTTDLSLFDSPEGVHEFDDSIYDRTGMCRSLYS